MRRLNQSDKFKVQRCLARRALMLLPYIDEQAEQIAWEAGETLLLLGKMKEDGSAVVHSRKTGFDYVIGKGLIRDLLVEKL